MSNKTLLIVRDVGSGLGVELVELEWRAVVAVVRETVRLVFVQRFDCDAEFTSKSRCSAEFFLVVCFPIMCENNNLANAHQVTLKYRWGERISGAIDDSSRCRCTTFSTSSDGIGDGIDLNFA